MELRFGKDLRKPNFSGTVNSIIARKGLTRWKIDPDKAKALLDELDTIKMNKQDSSAVQSYLYYLIDIERPPKEDRRGEIEDRLIDVGAIVFSSALATFMVGFFSSFFIDPRKPALITGSLILLAGAVSQVFDYVEKKIVEPRRWLNELDEIFRRFQKLS